MAADISIISKLSFLDNIGHTIYPKKHKTKQCIANDRVDK